MSGAEERGPGGEAGRRGLLRRPGGPVAGFGDASQRRMRTGWMVIGALAALTALEFWLSTAVASALGFLALTATAKAALIVNYFMHLGQVWRVGGGEE